MKVAINGFGRIGRATFKAIIENHPKVEIVAINDLTDTKTLAHLLKYDSCYGIYDQKISSTADSVVVAGKKYRIYAIKEPQNLPWRELGVDVVIECTGRFLTNETAGLHIEAGAKKVVLSAPAKEDDIKTFVLGVNEEEISKKDKVISMASCTTNCLAPVSGAIKAAFGIKKALMCTVHAYTADQNLVDGPHRDLRRARAAALSIIPTSTGAAKAVSKTIPSLAGKIDGSAYRVGTPTGSLCDTVFITEKKTSKEEVNDILRKAAKSPKLKGILVATDEPIVSIDIVGNPASSIVDLSLTKVVDGDMVKVVSWYDNEWGYSSRLAHIVDYLMRKKLY